MAAKSSIRHGFETVADHPALLLAEMSWRWCFAAGAWLLALVAVLEYLNSIPVSWRERLLLQSGDPLMTAAAIAHALQSSAARLAGSAIMAATAAAVLWIFAAAVGRLVTLNALLPEAHASYKPLLGLSFLRAGLFLAGVLAAGAALILAGFAGDAAPSLVLAATFVACIWLVWALLNWLLSLATIFMVRDQRDAFGAIGTAADFIRNTFGDLVLTSLPFVLLHYLALAAAVAAGLLVFDLMTRVSPEAGWALPAIAAGYFAYADFLYITRLAAYVDLAEPGGEPATVQEPAPPPSPDLPGAAEGQLPATSY